MHMIDLNTTCHITEYSPAKTGEYQSDIRQFPKLCILQKIFEPYNEDTVFIIELFPVAQSPLAPSLSYALGTQIMSMA